MGRDDQKTWGCLMLAGLPFAGIGLLMAYSVAFAFWEWAVMLGWEEVPARILEAELVSDHDGQSATYHVEALYEYDFRGERFRGDRVTLMGGSDNLGSFHHDTHAELSSYQQSGRAFRCYVDPDDPARSILYPVIRWEEVGFLALFAVIFGGVGFGMSGYGAYSLRHLKRTQRLKDLYPLQPWRWKREWSEKRIGSWVRIKFLALLGFALLWNLLTLPTAIEVAGEIDLGNPSQLLIFAFPLAGVILVIWTVVAYYQWRRLGSAWFEMAGEYGAPGGFLEGRLHIGGKELPNSGFGFRLMCVQGAGDSSRVLWQRSLTVPRERVERGPNGWLVPVRFSIPRRLPPSKEKDLEGPIEWSLEVSANFPEVYGKAEFKVPVFTPPGESPTEDEDSFNDVDLKELGIETALLTDGKHFFFKAGRHQRFAKILTFVTAIWTGLLVLFWALGMPLLILVVLGAVEACLLWAVLWLWLEERHVRTNAKGLEFSYRLWRIGSSRAVPADDVENLEVAPGMLPEVLGFYRIHLLTRQGRRHLLATQLGDLPLARRLAKELRRPLRPLQTRKDDKPVASADQ